MATYSPNGILLSMNKEKSVTPTSPEKDFTKMKDNIKRKRDETEFSLEQLQSLFHLPITLACLSLNTEVDTLIQRCRDLGIKRWPYNARKELNKTKKIEKKKEVYGVFFDFQIDQSTSKEKIMNVSLPSFKDFLNDVSLNKNVF